jgi:hypothetical protein
MGSAPDVSSCTQTVSTTKVKRPWASRPARTTGLCRQGQTHRGKVGRHRQLAPATVHQHGQLHAGRAAVVKQLIEHRAHRAAGVEHIVHHQHMRAVHIKGQRVCSVVALRPRSAKSSRCITDEITPDLTGHPRSRCKRCGQPGAALGHAHQVAAARPSWLAGPPPLCATRRTGLRHPVRRSRGQLTQGRLLKNCSSMMQADAASASFAPKLCASVVL